MRKINERGILLPNEGDVVQFKMGGKLHLGLVLDEIDTKNILVDTDFDKNFFLPTKNILKTFKEI